MDTSFPLSGSEPQLETANGTRSVVAIGISFMQEAIHHIMGSTSIYETLRVQEDITSGAGLSRKKLKDNFTKMARAIHPDKCLHIDAPAAFSKLRAAYDEINNDLDNPKPTVEPLPKLKSRQRRRVASATFRLLREATADLNSLAWEDMYSLKQSCNQSKRMAASIETEDHKTFKIMKYGHGTNSFSPPLDLFGSISPQTRPAQAMSPIAGMEQDPSGNSSSQEFDTILYKSEMEVDVLKPDLVSVFRPLLRKCHHQSSF